MSLKGRSVQQNVEKYLAGRLSLVILCRAAPGMLCSRQEKNKIMSSPGMGLLLGMMIVASIASKHGRLWVDTSKKAVLCGFFIFLITAPNVTFG